MRKIIKRAFINSFTTTFYIILIVLFLSSLQNIFPEETKSVIIPIFMLLLFVFSAALTGFLVFGKPVMLYLDGKKKEAISLLTYTLVILFIMVFLAFATMLIYFNI